MSPFIRNGIESANKYLQQHGDELKKLRNEFAGHLQLAGAAFATTKFTNKIGKVVWNSGTDGWTIGLECTFAGTVLVGIICSTLDQNADYRTEWTKAFTIMTDGFNHVQNAMTCLVQGFLWNRFGQ